MLDIRHRGFRINTGASGITSKVLLNLANTTAPIATNSVAIITLGASKVKIVSTYLSAFIIDERQFKAWNALTFLALGLVNLKTIGASCTVLTRATFACGAALITNYA